MSFEWVSNNQGIEAPAVFIPSKKASRHQVNANPTQIDARVGREALKTREDELARSLASLEQVKRSREEAERDLRGQHSQSVAALQDQLRAASKANLRIEVSKGPGRFDAVR